MINRMLKRLEKDLEPFIKGGKGKDVFGEKTTEAILKIHFGRLEDCFLGESEEIVPYDELRERITTAVLPADLIRTARKELDKGVLSDETEQRIITMIKEKEI